jgi:hypothetical protein
MTSPPEHPLQVANDQNQDGATAYPVPAESGTADGADVADLRAEVSALRRQLDRRQRRRSALTSLRRVAAAVLIMLTAFALIASIIGLWAATTTLNTNRWVTTVAPLPKQPAVAKAVAQYSTDQIFEVLDVDQRLRTVLPQQAGFIVGPLVSQVHDTVEKTVTNVLQSDRFQKIWIEANRRAHAQAMAIINGTSTVVAASGDHVNIDLLPLINQVLRQLSAQLPTLFGKQITLPDLSSGEIPANLRARVEDAFGVSLPANFAQFTIYDAGRLRAVQKAVVTVKRSLVLLVVGTLLLLALALLISPQRRRTLLQLGIWLVIAAVTVTASVRAAKTQLLEQIPGGVYRDGAAAAITTITVILRTRGVQIIWIGAILAVLMYLIGPGRIPVWLRRHTVLAARAAGRWLARGYRAAVANGPGWIARYLDAVRIGFVVLAVALALILSSWTALLVIALVLAVVEVLVTIIGRTGAQRETPAGPEAAAGDGGPDDRAGLAPA